MKLKPTACNTNFASKEEHLTEKKNSAKMLKTSFKDFVENGLQVNFHGSLIFFMKCPVTRM